MEINWTTIGILVAVWLVGYLLGLLESAIKESFGKDAPKKASLDSRGKETEGEKISDEAAPLDQEVLAIFQRISGAYRVRVDGKMIEYSDNLKPEERERLLAILVKMRPWVEKPKEAEPLSAKEGTQTTPSLARLDESEKVDEALEEIAFRELSMRAQIDYILQKKLEDHPLADRGIRLGSSASGGLIFQVGLDEYEWIDEIPDPAVIAIIKEATTEWEEKTGG